MIDWKNPFEGCLGVSIGEVAEALGVCKNTVRKELPNFDVTYFGDKPVISVASVVRRLNEKKTHAEPMRRLGRPRGSKNKPRTESKPEAPRRSRKARADSIAAE